MIHDPSDRPTPDADRRPSAQDNRAPSAEDNRSPSAAALPPSHLRPRSRDGWIATIVWLGLFLLAMPPITHGVLDRPEVWVAGVPVFFAALLGIYTALIAVLLWSLRRGL